MLRLYRTLFCLLLLGSGVSAPAFSLLGPFEAYQQPRIGYQQGGDIGGPLNIGEEYRWNIRTITYGFDESFLNYFGERGKQAVIDAIKILNDLPPVSTMSSNLAEFPLDTRRQNFQASALNLLDLKSVALSLLVEEMGLADPERFTWTLRNRAVVNATIPIVNYTVIKRNFDPVTFAPSSYVNGILFTYSIFDDFLNFSDALDNTVDPTAFRGSAVASSSFTLGQFYTGLTRDDVGGLRYLYRPSNYNTETLVPGSIGSANSPWTPIGQTNIAVNTALRPGVDKITFQLVNFNSELGRLSPAITQTYTDVFVTNSALVTQTIQRSFTNAPDILFAADDLAIGAGGFPLAALRTAATGGNWQNNDGINGQVALAGPGQIQAPGTAAGVVTPITITFNKVGPFVINQFPNFLDELNIISTGFIWGSFDGSTNPPTVYPDGTSLRDIELQVLSGP